MIRSFADKETQDLFEDKRTSRFGTAVASARRKLLLLHAAHRIEDLRVPPGNRLEALAGDRKGQWSVRVNDRWRLCFRWEEEDAHDVEIVDYHRG